MRISDWSSDVCSSDLSARSERRRIPAYIGGLLRRSVQPMFAPVALIIVIIGGLILAGIYVARRRDALSRSAAAVLAVLVIVIVAGLTLLAPVPYIVSLRDAGLCRCRQAWPHPGARRGRKSGV